MISRYFVCAMCLSFLGFLSLTRVRAGVSADEEGSCTAGGPISTTVMVNAASHDSLRIRDSFGSPGPTRCTADTILRLTNEPEGRAIGDTLDASRLTDRELSEWVGQFGKLWDSGVDVWHSPTVHIGRCEAEGCAAAGPFRGTVVLVLAEGSPAPATVVETAAPVSTAANLGIPFVIAQAGDDDWLEMSNRGRIFWKTPLKDLRPGELYFAVVPPEVMDSRPAVWTIYLNSYGARDSTVYVALPTAHQKF